MHVDDIVYKREGEGILTFYAKFYYRNKWQRRMDLYQSTKSTYVESPYLQKSLIWTYHLFYELEVL